MSARSDATNTPPSKTMTQRALDTVERVGNSVPHPVVIFLILIAIVLVLSHLLYMLGASVTYQAINPDTHKIETATSAANSLLTADGIRHIYTRLVPNLMGFSAVGLLIVAMMGVGVAEDAGLVNALIRKLVAGGTGLHRRVRRHSVQHRRRCRLCGVDPVGGRGLPECWPASPRWAGCGVCRSRRCVHREHDYQTA